MQRYKKILKYANFKRTFNISHGGYMSLVLVGVLAVLVLVGCRRSDAGSRGCSMQVCGVLAEGTPWELASTLASQREGGFVPECVEVYKDKAYIKGWIDTNGTNEPYRVAPYDDGFLPAEIWCDLSNGQVTHAGFYCEFLDK